MPAYVNKNATAALSRVSVASRNMLKHGWIKAQIEEKGSLRRCNRHSPSHVAYQYRMSNAKDSKATGDDGSTTSCAAATVSLDRNVTSIPDAAHQSYAHGVSRQPHSSLGNGQKTRSAGVWRRKGSCRGHEAWYRRDPGYIKRRRHEYSR